jgi:hypothetical protein
MVVELVSVNHLTDRAVVQLTPENQGDQEELKKLYDRHLHVSSAEEGNRFRNIRIDVVVQKG